MYSHFDWSVLKILKGSRGVEKPDSGHALGLHIFELRPGTRVLVVTSEKWGPLDLRKELH